LKLFLNKIYYLNSLLQRNFNFVKNYYVLREARKVRRRFLPLNDTSKKKLRNSNNFLKCELRY
jgi:hypothetical protein